MSIVETLLKRMTPLTPQEAAEALGLNERTVRNWLNAGRVPWGYKIGFRWKIDPTILATWMESQR